MKVLKEFFIFFVSSLLIDVFTTGHTLGNSLRWMASKHKEVKFCGYETTQDPPKMSLRIITHEKPATQVKLLEKHVSRYPICFPLKMLVFFCVLRDLDLNV